MTFIARQTRKANTRNRGWRGPQRPAPMTLPAPAGASRSCARVFRRRQTDSGKWRRAASETKSVRTRSGPTERAKTALMVAPTWSEIDQLNITARHRLRADDKLAGRDQEFVSLRAKDWTRAQNKDVRNYRPGDIQATKHFAKGSELQVIRKERCRLIVLMGAVELSISPKQAGLTWTACEECKTPLATGDRLRSHFCDPRGSHSRPATPRRLRGGEPRPSSSNRAR